MVEVQEKKFVCKICGKGFSNGKCMGGHLAKNSAKKNGNQIPQKRIPLEGNQCKQCGKEFPSLRALSGHMQCHSIKAREESDNKCKQCGKVFDSMRALFGHMRHHSKRSTVPDESETLCPIQKKRSRMRYKIDGKFSVSDLGESFDVSAADEVEEAAVCLIMLSRGVTIWVNFNSVLESSEDYSETFKAKALDQGKKPQEKVDHCVSCSGNSLFGKNKSEFNELCSGFLSNNEKNDECKSEEFDKPELEDESRMKWTGR